METLFRFTDCATHFNAAFLFTIYGMTLFRVPVSPLRSLIFYLFPDLLFKCYYCYIAQNERKNTCFIAPICNLYFVKIVIRSIIPKSIAEKMILHYLCTTIISKT